MSEPLTPADRSFLNDLLSLETATIAELCNSQGVTTNAVRTRVTKLLAAGLVERTVVRQGRGRPQHEYKVSREGKRLLGNNYSELALVLWKQLNQIENEPLREQIANDLRNTLVERYGQGIDAVDLSERILQLQQIMQSYGYEIELDEEGGKVSLTEKSCPYHDLAIDDRSICELEQSVFEQILGVPLELTHRCVDGDGCCRFEPVELSVEPSR